jgi:hypothetical protein
MLLMSGDRDVGQDMTLIGDHRPISAVDPLVNEPRGHNASPLVRATLPPPQLARWPQACKSWILTSGRFTRPLSSPHAGARPIPRPHLDDDLDLHRIDSVDTGDVVLLPDPEQHLGIRRPQSADANRCHSDIRPQPSISSRRHRRHPMAGHTPLPGPGLANDFSNGVDQVCSVFADCREIGPALLILIPQIHVAGLGECAAALPCGHGGPTRSPLWL